jgi:anti-sigma factor ChrR (cupin superfamily)
MNGEHKHPNDESTERITAYVLGMLSLDDARGLEQHIREGCQPCATALHEFRSVADLWLHKAAPVSPPSSVKTRLMQAIQEGKPERTQVWKDWSANPSEPFHIVRSGDRGWQRTSIEGISVKRLAVNKKDRRVTMLVQMAPGTQYPRHRHGDSEECFVLDGELYVGDEVLRAGDFQRADKDSIHPIQRTEKGCTVLIVSSLHDEILD